MLLLRAAPPALLPLPEQQLPWLLLHALLWLSELHRGCLCSTAAGTRLVLFPSAVYDACYMIQFQDCCASNHVKLDWTSGVESISWLQLPDLKA